MLSSRLPNKRGGSFPPLYITPLPQAAAMEDLLFCGGRQKRDQAAPQQAILRCSNYRGRKRGGGGSGEEREPPSSAPTPVHSVLSKMQGIVIVKAHPALGEKACDASPSCAPTTALCPLLPWAPCPQAVKVPAAKVAPDPARHEYVRGSQSQEPHKGRF
ncbi:apoptosis-enhancing nuclease [Platysternon megacephalum]|uniref:Apoptosis-enhancing nuclease n=1 Tax=Platysternon megacephalum TaxID=55544 RepID=A0A4D9F5D1_9SAUR|nr:apoptosis-enhancing nuclease [Platysternon megacephalum]